MATVQKRRAKGVDKLNNEKQEKVQRHERGYIQSSFGIYPRKLHARIAFAGLEMPNPILRKISHGQ